MTDKLVERVARALDPVLWDDVAVAHVQDRVVRSDRAQSLRDAETAITATGVRELLEAAKNVQNYYQGCLDGKIPATVEGSAQQWIALESAIHKVEA